MGVDRIVGFHYDIITRREKSSGFILDTEGTGVFVTFNIEEPSNVHLDKHLF